MRHSTRQAIRRVIAGPGDSVTKCAKVKDIISRHLDHPKNDSALAKAAKSLVNSLPDSELDIIRGEWGNTNVNVVKHWRDEVSKTLAHSQNDSAVAKEAIAEAKRLQIDILKVELPYGRSWADRVGKLITALAHSQEGFL